MANYNNIFSTEIEVPEIVKQKVEAAFEQIKTEEIGIMKENKKRNIFFRNHVAAAAICICVLGVGSITVVAGVHYYWSRAMQGAIQASEEEQLELKKEGIASVMAEAENYEKLSVTDNNVTITPETVIVDEKFAYVSFSVKGYTLGPDVEPGFENVNVYIGEDSEPQAINMEGSFYDGIIMDEAGSAIYDDGTPLKQGEDGNTISHYVDENGNLEYVVRVSVADYADSLLGKTLHVDFENLGSVYKAEYEGALEACWNFDIDLSSNKSTDTMVVDKSVEGTNFVLNTVAISPVSIQLNYSVNGEVKMAEGENGAPDFCGVLLKDGTRIPYLSNGGMTGYTDDTMTAAYAFSTFDRVVHVEDIASLLVRTKAGTDLVEIEIK